MTLSVIIPVWSNSLDLIAMAASLCKQVRPMCDELIVGESGSPSAELEEIADIYLKHPRRLSHGDNINRCIEVSTGDFLAIIDSDVVINSGDLRKLCIPGKVVCPIFNNLREARRFNGFFFVSPREILEEFPIFERPGPEGIDHWVREFTPLIEQSGRYHPSEDLSYTHLGARSYGALMAQLRTDYQEARGAENRLQREIMPDRHRQRLADDPEYASAHAGDVVPPAPTPPVFAAPPPPAIVPEELQRKKLAMIVPTFSKDARRLSMARHTCSIWRKHVDELIIIEDGGIFDEELAKIAHIYIYHADNIGPCNNMNMGWQLAHARGADFVVISDSDVQLRAGALRYLCEPGKVSTPTVAQHPDSAACIAPMLCVPREITDQVGMYSDRGGAHRNESFDADYAARLIAVDRDIITKNRDVIIWHTGSATRFDHEWSPLPEN